jgi:hypothetical protein
LSDKASPLKRRLIEVNGIKGSPNGETACFICVTGILQDAGHFRGWSFIIIWYLKKNLLPKCPTGRLFVLYYKSAQMMVSPVEKLQRNANSEVLISFTLV